MTTPSHETLREQLLDLAYGELGRREARALEKHLQGCAACRAEYERMTATRTAMAGLGDVPAPERGEAILVAAAREAARSREAERRPFLPAWLWGTSLGAVSLVAVAVLSVKLAGEARGPGLRRSGDELVAVAPAEPAVTPPAAPAPPGDAEATAQPAPAAEQAGASAEERAAAKIAREEKPSAPAAPKASLAKVPPAPRSDAGTYRRRDSFDEGGGALGALGGTGDKGRGATLDDSVAAEGARAVVEKKKDAGKERFAVAPPSEPAPAAARPAPPPAVAAPSAPELEAQRAPMATSAPDGEAAQDLAAQEALSEVTSGAGGAAAGATVAKSEAAPPPAAALRRSAPGARAAAAEDAMARYARLRAAGRLRTVTRTFPGCAGEAERVVELDDAGDVVKLTRRGAHQGAPYEVELFYGDDGLLGAARWRSGGRVRELRAGPPGTSMSAAGVPAAALQPQRAAAAGPDAPPRCGS